MTRCYFSYSADQISVAQSNSILTEWVSSRFCCRGNLLYPRHVRKWRRVDECDVSDPSQSSSNNQYTVSTSNRVLEYPQSQIKASLGIRKIVSVTVS